jgi:16S rRNA (cytosine1402-N4)-methyltransferase
VTDQGAEPGEPGVLHRPVLLHQTLAALAPRGGGRYCDLTLGLGGHAEAVLEASAPDGRLIGFDRDTDALALARARLSRFGDRVAFHHAPFAQARATLEQAGALPLDGCLADLGVSSPQLDRAERGFSFRRSGPLDMRMDQSSGESAAEYLARVEEDELVGVLRDLGEERFARRIARFIVEDRGKQPLLTTGDLAELVARAVPRREHHKDPATRTFQALRIVVNGELDQLERMLDELPGCLAPGGRLCVISFHSLEDRMVKWRFRTLAQQSDQSSDVRYRIVTKKPITADDDELAANPRARSAKLRVLERLRPGDDGDGHADDEADDAGERVMSKYARKQARGGQA